MYNTYFQNLNFKIKNCDIFSKPCLLRYFMYKKLWKLIYKLKSTATKNQDWILQENSKWSPWFNVSYQEQFSKMYVNTFQLYSSFVCLFIVLQTEKYLCWKYLVECNTFFTFFVFVYTFFSFNFFNKRVHFKIRIVN